MNNGSILLMFRKIGDTYIFDHIAISTKRYNTDIIMSDKIDSKDAYFFNKILSSGDFLTRSDCSEIEVIGYDKNAQYAYYILPDDLKSLYAEGSTVEQRVAALEYITKLAYNLNFICEKKDVNRSYFRVEHRVEPAEIIAAFALDYSKKFSTQTSERNSEVPRKEKNGYPGTYMGSLNKELLQNVKENVKDRQKFEAIKQRSLDMHKIGRDYEYKEEPDVDLEKQPTNITDAINVNEMIDQIKRKLIGQEEAVTSVVSNIYANQKIVETGNKGLISTQKSAILLDGTTGTGKTALIKEVSEKLSIPMVVTNATSYSTTGYIGDSIIDILSKLLEQANGDIELAQRGIVCIDEIDKLAQGDMQKSIEMRKAVQHDLLSFISGAKYKIKVGGMYGSEVEFDTTNLTVICMGAFTELRDKKIKQKQKPRVAIGFNSAIEEKEPEEDRTYTITAQDYVNFGLERELVGRFSLLASTKTYTVEDYKKILLESDISPLKNFIEFAKSFGIEEVKYDEDFIQRMAEMAYEDNFGARGLHQIIANLKNTLLLDIINLQSKTIYLTTEMLDKVREKNIRRY